VRWDGSFLLLLDREAWADPEITDAFKASFGASTPACSDRPRRLEQWH
jgi:hypothetical protein